MTDHERDRFDAIVEDVLDALPPRIRAMLDEMPLIVEDLPDDEMLASVDMSPEEAEELCGLHTGTANIDASIESPDLSPTIHLFRVGILREAGQWSRVAHEVRVTLLHEIGHQFGLDEDDLDALGYA
ncbi:MAG: metallopeptidase family protein [Phycisphaerales bacterium]|nr:metallopeptidase family protein [Phycisphaerales bacterium]